MIKYVINTNRNRYLKETRNSYAHNKVHIAKRHTNKFSINIWLRIRLNYRYYCNKISIFLYDNSLYNDEFTQNMGKKCYSH